MDNRIPAAFGIIAAGALLARTRAKEGRVERLAAATFETLLNAVEANDPETGMHLRRTAARALIIADAAGLDERCQRAVELVALFHDIGKIHEALFDIVHERSKLTPAERRAITTHPIRGAEVLAPLEAFYPELPAGVLAHHERWDGTGYPRGLRGRRIPIEARISSIADTIDAVECTRRYRRGAGPDAAFDVIAAGRGTQFDPDLVDLALLPPVAHKLAHVRVAKRATHGRRRSNERERVPEISFRWRSESLRSRRVGAMRRVD
jgi:HD-GYP domain-containing protein (c-di-GMP phosphodiesterase class II)